MTELLCEGPTGCAWELLTSLLSTCLLLFCLKSNCLMMKFSKDERQKAFKKNAKAPKEMQVSSKGQSFD